MARLLATICIALLACSCGNTETSNAIKWMEDVQGLQPTETLSQIKPRYFSRLCELEFDAISTPNSTKEAQQVCFCSWNGTQISFDSNEEYYLLREVDPNEAPLFSIIFDTENPADSSFRKNAMLVWVSECVGPSSPINRRKP